MVDLKIKMSRSKPSFCLMAGKLDGKNPDYKVTLQHASLFIRKMKVNPCVSLIHAKA